MHNTESVRYRLKVLSVLVQGLSHFVFPSCILHMVLGNTEQALALALELFQSPNNEIAVALQVELMQIFTLIT